MRIYDLDAHELARALDGTRTLLLSKVSGRKHPEVGQAVLLTEGGKRRRVPKADAEGLCILRGRVEICPTGVLRVLGLTHAGDAEGLARLVWAAEQGAAQAADHALKLARALGFDSFENLFAAEAASQGRGTHTHILREVVGWADAKAVR